MQTKVDVDTFRMSLFNIWKGKHFGLELKKSSLVQCPHSEEEDSVATICGFEDKFQDLKV